MVKATVYLEPADASVLRELSKKEGKSQAAVLREAVGFYLERFGRLASARAALSENRREGRARLERHFGSIDLGRPLGTDNEEIDADLARSYDGIDPSS